MIMCIQNLVSICLFVLKILSKNQNLTSIKGLNSVVNLRKTMIYISNVDLVKDYVYTKFGLNRSICFQDIEQLEKVPMGHGCPYLLFLFHLQVNIRYTISEQDTIYILQTQFIATLFL